MEVDELILPESLRELKYEYIPSRKVLVAEDIVLKTQRETTVTITKSEHWARVKEATEKSLRKNHYCFHELYLRPSTERKIQEYFV